MTTNSRAVAAFAFAAVTLVISGCDFDLPDTFDVKDGSTGREVHVRLSVASCAKYPNPDGSYELVCSVGPVEGSIDLGSVVVLDSFDDPLIVQVPASSSIGGEAFVCMPFLGSELCSSIGSLKVTQGLASIPVDIHTQLQAEAGMQLAIIDFPPFPPGTAPPAKYKFVLQWVNPAPTVKALFAVKAQLGGTTYYAPFLPCTADMTSVPALPASVTVSAAELVSAVTSMTPCNHKAYDFGVAGPPGGGANYQGLWWNSPANSESGWGLNLAHQGDTIFASWFTYDTSGRDWWLVMTAQKSGPNTYSGKLYQTRGPAFDAANFDPATVVATEAGSGTLTFSDSNNGTFSYTIGAVAQAKTITREQFGPLPTCTYGGGSLTLATNYQDLWWAKPAASESGWGINLNHEGDKIFATWFTYDLDQAPLWLVVTAPRQSAGVYSGDLYQTSGARFDAFDPAKVTATKVGTATFTFADGNNATFAYTVQLPGMGAPVAQAKAITRELFSASGTTCL
jgi:hypothetical protein